MAGRGIAAGLMKRAQDRARRPAPVTRAGERIIAARVGQDGGQVLDRYSDGWHAVSGFTGSAWDALADYGADYVAFHVDGVVESKPGGRAVELAGKYDRTLVTVRGRMTGDEARWQRPGEPTRRVRWTGVQVKTDGERYSER